MKNAGAMVDVVAPKDGKSQGFKHRTKGKSVSVDKTIDAVDPEDYVGLVLPAGVANPDALRIDERGIFRARLLRG